MNLDFIPDHKIANRGLLVEEYKEIIKNCRKLLQAYPKKKIPNGTSKKLDTFLRLNTVLQKPGSMVLKEDPARELEGRVCHIQGLLQLLEKSKNKFPEINMGVPEKVVVYGKEPKKNAPYFEYRQKGQFPWLTALIIAVLAILVIGGIFLLIG